MQRPHEGEEAEMKRTILIGVGCLLLAGCVASTGEDEEEDDDATLGEAAAALTDEGTAVRATVIHAEHSAFQPVPHGITVGCPDCQDPRLPFIDDPLGIEPTPVSPVAPVSPLTP
jgi:hypothetical protein